VPRRALVLALLVLAVSAVPSGCGAADELDKAGKRVERGIADARREFRKQREKLRERVREVLGQLEKALPEAPVTNPQVQARGRTEPGTIDAFMEDVLGNIDRYWTRTFAENGLPEPRVGFSSVPPGAQAASRCGIAAGDSSAFYCTGDDTIYVGAQFAADLYEGVAQGLPGESAGYGHAAGDFAVAYVLAHEYAHNVQQELGIFNRRSGPEAKPFELQADCLAGSWANSAYEQGLLKPGDLDEILDTALAVGDFEVGTKQHHGTPEQRRSAVLAGFRSGDPSACSRYVPGL
jgi:predicted metalloprotease